MRNSFSFLGGALFSAAAFLLYGMQSTGNSELLLSGDAKEFLSHVSMVDLPDGFGGSLRTARITRLNLQIVNGMGTTDQKNGGGNLIVGYNELGNLNGDDRTGSHMIIVGRKNSYSSFGGIVAGSANSVRGGFGCVTGGAGNRAVGMNSAVSGGSGNLAEGMGASVSGGGGNYASGTGSSVSGGQTNTAGNEYTSVTGGWLNTAGGEYSTVSGGMSNGSGGDLSVVCGGQHRGTSGTFNWAAGSLYETQ